VSTPSSLSRSIDPQSDSELDIPPTSTLNHSSDHNEHASKETKLKQPRKATQKKRRSLSNKEERIKIAPGDVLSSDEYVLDADTNFGDLPPTIPVTSEKALISTPSIRSVKSSANGTTGKQYKSPESVLL